MTATKRRWSNLFGAILHFSFAALFGLCFYDRFWVWRKEIAQVETSFVTPDGINVTSGGMIWALPAALFACLGAFQMAKFAFLTQDIQAKPFVDANPE